MNELTMNILDVEIEEKLLVRLMMETTVDGVLYDVEKSIRLGKWDDAEKKLVEDEAVEAKAMELIERVFGITDLADLGTIIGNDYQFFMSDEGVVYLEEPTWYADKLVLDEYFAKVEKPKASLAGLNSKGILEHVHTSENGTTLFIEVTGKNGKGTHVIVNNRYGKYTEDDKFKRDFKKKIKTETRLKTAFNINSMNELPDKVGEIVIIKYETAPNGSVYVSCSGLDE